MRTYETTFILGPQADEATFDQQVKAVSDIITNNQGKIHKEERIGIRRLAFPIKKYTQGYYTRFIYDANNTVLNEMDRFFKLEEPYIRFLTVIHEGKSEPFEELIPRHKREQRDKVKAEPKPEVKVVEPQVVESTETLAEEKEVPVKPETSEPESPEADKVSDPEPPKTEEQ